MELIDKMSNIIWYSREKGYDGWVVTLARKN
jgi:hypothetical protein